VSWAKKGGRTTLTIYTSYDVFLHKELPFEGCNDVRTVIFLITDKINSLMHYPVR